MNKKINFIPVTKPAEISSDHPLPSYKFIPEWYKDISPYYSGDKKIKIPFGENIHNHTVKKCIPFLDALTIGYMAVLDDDIIIELVNGQPYMRWLSDQELITFHGLEQYKGLPIQKDYHNMVAKWHNEWEINTPKEYSTMFFHPNNRIDLPFYTLSGVVDTDIYKNEIHFPFILKKDFEGIIKSGTPVAQLVMIKRETWKSNRQKFNEDDRYGKMRSFKKTIGDSYKKNIWKKKHYE